MPKRAAGGPRASVTRTLSARFRGLHGTRPKPMSARERRHSILKNLVDVSEMATVNVPTMAPRTLHFSQPALEARYTRAWRRGARRRLLLLLAACVVLVGGRAAACSHGRLDAPEWAVLALLGVPLLALLPAASVVRRRARRLPLGAAAALYVATCMLVVDSHELCGAGDDAEDERDLRAYVMSSRLAVLAGLSGVSLRITVLAPVLVVYAVGSSVVAVALQGGTAADVAFLLTGAAVAVAGEYVRERARRQRFLLGSELRRAGRQLEDVLHNILPTPVCERVLRGDAVIDEFKHLTIMFCTIESFDEITEACSAQQLFDLLNTIYSDFDQLVLRSGLYKVENIERDYVVASDLVCARHPVAVDSPTYRRETAKKMLHLAFAFLTKRYYAPDGRQVQLRIGINAGPAVAGIIGSTRKYLRLFGDTMNTASRMQAHGAPGLVHLAQPAYELIKDAHTYWFESRGEVEIKGKGPMPTYFAHRIDESLTETMRLLGEPRQCGMVGGGMGPRPVSSTPSEASSVASNSADELEAAGTPSAVAAAGDDTAQPVRMRRAGTVFQDAAREARFTREQLQTSARAAQHSWAAVGLAAGLVSIIQHVGGLSDDLVYAWLVPVGALCAAAASAAASAAAPANALLVVNALGLAALLVLPTVVSTTAEAERHDQSAFEPTVLALLALANLKVQMAPVSLGVLGLAGGLLVQGLRQLSEAREEGDDHEHEHEHGSHSGPATLLICLAVGGLLVVRQLQTEDRDQRIAWMLRQRVSAATNNTTRLLACMFPRQLVDQMLASESTIDAHQAMVVCLYADLVNFTPLAARMTPVEVVGVLDRVYGAFDAAVDEAGLWKMDTVGDAYVVLGWPKPTSVAETSLKVIALAETMIKVLAHFRLESGLDVHMRFGVHVGPAVAGIVGELQQRYHVYGKTLLGATALEAAAERDRVHVSGALAGIVRARVHVEPSAATPGAFYVTEGSPSTTGDLDLRLRRVQDELDRLTGAEDSDSSMPQSVRGPTSPLTVAVEAPPPARRRRSSVGGAVAATHAAQIAQLTDAVGELTVENAALREDVDMLRTKMARLELGSGGSGSASASGTGSRLSVASLSRHVEEALMTNHSLSRIDGSASSAPRSRSGSSVSPASPVSPR